MTTQQRARPFSPEVRARKEQRLAHLEEQAAIYGIDVPPHIANEIEDLQVELELISVINRPAIDPQIKRAMVATNYADLIGKFIGDHARRLTSIESWLQRREETVERERIITVQRDRRVSATLGGLLFATVINLLFGLVILIALINLLSR